MTTKYKLVLEFDSMEELNRKMKELIGVKGEETTKPAKQAGRPPKKQPTPQFARKQRNNKHWTDDEIQTVKLATKAYNRVPRGLASELGRILGRSPSAVAQLVHYLKKQKQTKSKVKPKRGRPKNSGSHFDDKKEEEFIEMYNGLKRGSDKAPYGCAKMLGKKFGIPMHAIYTKINELRKAGKV